MQATHSLDDVMPDSQSHMISNFYIPCAALHCLCSFATVTYWKHSSKCRCILVLHAKGRVYHCEVG